MSNVDGAVWRRFLAEQKLDTAVAAELAALARPQIRLIPKEICEEDETPPWTSKLGGSPDLPEDVAWPVLDAAAANYQVDFDWAPGQLAFLAQINLADIARIGCDLPVPEDGLLLFFYDAESQPWGFDPGDAPGSCVIFVPAGAPTRRRESEEPGKARTRELTFVAAERIPDELTIDEYLVDPRTKSAWVELYPLDALDSARDPKDEAGDEHLFGGWPQVIQNPMEIECEMVANGISAGEPGAFQDARMTLFEKDARRWKLLLQLATDDDFGWEWGDMGMVYFWCREEDIAARRFDRVWTIMQCG